MSAPAIVADREGPLEAVVVAMALNGVIGRDGGLAWRVSDDLKWFRRVTTGKPMIMGRRTFDSIGRPLPDRDTIVVSRKAGLAVPGAFVVADLARARDLARDLATARGAFEYCVVGGAEIYAQRIGSADRMYFTEIEAEPVGDVRFPAFDPADWRISRMGRAEAGPRNDHAATFYVFDRRA